MDKKIITAVAAVATTAVAIGGTVIFNKHRNNVVDDETINNVAENVVDFAEKCNDVIIED